MVHYRHQAPRSQPAKKKKVTKKLKYESDAGREDPTEANIVHVHPTMSNNVLIKPHQRTISSDHHRVHEKCICRESKSVFEAGLLLQIKIIILFFFKEKTKKQKKISCPRLSEQHI